jgi:hypothetical protein
VPTGHIVWRARRKLIAVAFDVRRLQVTSGPVPVVEGAGELRGSSGSAHFSVSGTGSLVYIPGPVRFRGAAGMALIDRRTGRTAEASGWSALDAARVS